MTRTKKKPTKPPKRPIEFKFIKGETVLVRQSSLLHDGTVLQRKMGIHHPNKYLVHILNHQECQNTISWDRWVFEDKILKYDDAGLIKKDELLQEHRQANLNHKVVNRTSNHAPKNKMDHTYMEMDTNVQEKGFKSRRGNGSNNKESSANLTVSSPTLLQIAKVRYRDLLVKIYSLDSNARQFFFEPLVLLDRSSVTLMKNGFFKSDVLRFTIQMWNQELRSKVLERLRALDSLRDVEIEEDDICIMPFEEVQLVCTSGSLPHSISLSDKPTCYLRSNENLDLFLFCNEPSSANVLTHDFRQSPDLFFNEWNVKLICRGLVMESGTAPAGLTSPHRPTFSHSISVFPHQFTKLPESANKSTVSLASPRPVADEGIIQSGSIEVTQQLRTSNQSGYSDQNLNDSLTAGQLDVSAVKIKKCPAGARLSWEAPQSASGEITEYSVSIAMKGSLATQSEESWSYTRVYVGSSPKCTVPNATLASAYIDTTIKPAIIFRIAARSEKGYGPATQVMWAQDKVPAVQIKQELIKVEPVEPGGPENTTAIGVHSRV